MNTTKSGNVARVEEMVKDPTVRFSSPREVLDDATLAITEKRRILESWVKDAELLAEAETENMSGGENSRLRESKLALATLQDAVVGTKPLPGNSSQGKA